MKDQKYFVYITSPVNFHGHNFLVERSAYDSMMINKNSQVVTPYYLTPLGNSTQTKKQLAESDCFTKEEVNDIIDFIQLKSNPKSPTTVHYTDDIDWFYNKIINKQV